MWGIAIGSDDTAAAAVVVMVSVTATEAVVFAVIGGGVCEVEEEEEEDGDDNAADAAVVMVGTNEVCVSLGTGENLSLMQSFPFDENAVLHLSNTVQLSWLFDLQLNCLG